MSCCEEHDWEIIDEWFYDDSMFGGVVRRTHVAKQKCKKCGRVQEEEMYWKMLYDERN